MSLYTTTRIPVDDKYSALVGKAVYIFAYYEWTIIWIIERLDKGFLSKYHRGNPMTSGDVKMKLQEVINNSLIKHSNISKKELQECCDTFGAMIVKRNALIHAHPITDTTGAQILAFHTKPSKPLPDIKWSIAEVEIIISEIDAAESDAAVIFDKIR